MATGQVFPHLGEMKSLSSLAPVLSPSLSMISWPAPLVLTGTQAYSPSSQSASPWKDRPCALDGAHQDCVLAPMVESTVQGKDLDQSWAGVLVLTTGSGASPFLACDLGMIPPAAHPRYCWGLTLNACCKVWQAAATLEAHMCIYSFVLKDSKVRRFHYFLLGWEMISPQGLRSLDQFIGGGFATRATGSEV